MLEFCPFVFVVSARRAAFESSSCLLLALKNKQRAGTTVVYEAVWVLGVIIKCFHVGMSQLAPIRWSSENLIQLVCTQIALWQFHKWPNNVKIVNSFQTLLTIVVNVCFSIKIDWIVESLTLRGQLIYKSCRSVTAQWSEYQRFTTTIQSSTSIRDFHSLMSINLFCYIFWF